MRLIDADELKKQIDECKYFNSSFQKLTVAEFLTIIQDYIDNAPTVEFSKEICSACGRYIREKGGADMRGDNNETN